MQQEQEGTNTPQPPAAGSPPTPTGAPVSLTSEILRSIYFKQYKAYFSVFRQGLQAPAPDIAAGLQKIIVENYGEEYTAVTWSQLPQWCKEYLLKRLLQKTFAGALLEELFDYFEDKHIKAQYFVLGRNKNAAMHIVSKGYSDVAMVLIKIGDESIKLSLGPTGQIYILKEDGETEAASVIDKIVHNENEGTRDCPQFYLDCSPNDVLIYIASDHAYSHGNREYEESTDATQVRFKLNTYVTGENPADRQVHYQSELTQLVNNAAANLNARLRSLKTFLERGKAKGIAASMDEQVDATLVASLESVIGKIVVETHKSLANITGSVRRPAPAKDSAPSGSGISPEQRAEAEAAAAARAAAASVRGEAPSAAGAATAVSAAVIPSTAPPAPVASNVDTSQPDRSGMPKPSVPLTETVMEARFQELQRQGKGVKDAGLAHKPQRDSSWEDALQVPAADAVTTSAPPVTVPQLPPSTEASAAVTPAVVQEPAPPVPAIPVGFDQANVAQNTAQSVRTRTVVFAPVATAAAGGSAVSSPGCATVGNFVVPQGLAATTRVPQALTMTFRRVPAQASTAPAAPAAPVAPAAPTMQPQSPSS